MGCLVGDDYREFKGNYFSDSSVWLLRKCRVGINMTDDQKENFDTFRVPIVCDPEKPVWLER